MVVFFHDIAVLFLYVACIQLLLLANSKINKTEDPSVPYAGQGYVTQRRVSHDYYSQVNLRNTKEP